MYKKQMIFQRVICYLVLVASALVFIYSLGIMTDVYECLAQAVTVRISNGKVTYTERVKGAMLYYDMQEFNSQLTMVGIGLILAALLLFVLSTNSRRRYYVGNFVSVAVSVGACGAATVWALPLIEKYKQQFLGVDFAGLKEYSDLWKTKYTESTFWFDLGYILFGVLILVNILLVVNMIMKIILMKEEKRTIGSSRKDVGA